MFEETRGRRLAEFTCERSQEEKVEVTGEEVVASVAVKTDTRLRWRAPLLNQSDGRKDRTTHARNG